MFEIPVGVLDEASEGFLVAESERVIHANEACSEISGYSVEELLALPSLSDLIVLEEGGPSLECLRPAPDNQVVPERYEAAIICKGGRRVGVDLVVKPLGEGARRVIVLHDPARRERAEEKIRFRARLVEAVGQAVVAIDLRGIVIYWNHAAEALYGWSVEEHAGHAMVEVVVDADQVERASEIAAELNAARN